MLAHKNLAKDIIKKVLCHFDNQITGMHGAAINKTMDNILQPSPEVIKNFMLNSAEHEILNAHNYNNIKKLSFRLRQA